MSIYHDIFEYMYNYSITDYKARCNITSITLKKLQLYVSAKTETEKTRKATYFLKAKFND